MLINGIKNFNLHEVEFKKIQPSTHISFKGNNDVFVSTPEVVKGTIDRKELDSILKHIQEAKPNSSGFTSKVFKIGDKIIKVPADKTFPDEQTEQHAKGQNLKEFYALSKIQDINPEIATKPYAVIRNKDKHYLIEEFIEGIHPQGHKMTDAHLADLLTKFFQLDKNGLTNCDLQNGNIFLTKDGKTKLIDFGSFSFILNEGRVYGSDYTPTSVFQDKIYKDTSLDSSIKFLKTFLASDFVDTKNSADNPYLCVPSNASNFEFRFLYTHLLDNSEDNPLEFFKRYLKSKAQNYHSKMREFLESLDIKQAKLDSEGYSKDVIDTIESNLKSAINYEKLIAEILSNPTEDVIKVELAKLQLRTFLNFWDSMNSPIENAKKLQAAYNQLITLLEESIKNSDGNEKEYFNQTLNYYKDKFKDYTFDNGQVSIPENENLIKVLFKQQTENIQEKTIDTIKTTAKGFNKKLGLAIAFGAAIMGGIAAFIIKQNKNSKAKQATPSVDSNNQTNTNYLLKNIPNTFSKFQTNI